MGITMYNGLRKTRDVTKDSPKQITEIPPGYEADYNWVHDCHPG